MTYQMPPALDFTNVLMSRGVAEWLANISQETLLRVHAELGGRRIDWQADNVAVAVANSGRLPFGFPYTEEVEYVWLGDLSGYRLAEDGDEDGIWLVHRCGWEHELSGSFGDCYLANIIEYVLSNPHDCRDFT